MEAKTIKKYATKTISQLLQLATKHFNAYIRKRDSNEKYFVCISCGQTKAKKHLQAGHYIAAGQNPAVRFDERNVHGQCIQCNYHLHGNQAAYRENLKRKIGTQELEALELKAQRGKSAHSWDKYTLIELIEEYKNKT